MSEFNWKIARSSGGISRRGNSVATAWLCTISSCHNTWKVRIMPEYHLNLFDNSKFRSVEIGQRRHAAKSAVSLAKIEWHPWGEAGSTLCVMTMDGKLR
jgi:hypothetical protein